MREVVQLFDDVYLLCGTIGERPLNLPLLVGSDHVVLVDTGCAPDVEELILPSLNQIGLEPSNLTLVCITHPDMDHQGGNRGVKEHAPDALLACGGTDEAQVADPDVIYQERYDAYRERHDHYYGEQTEQYIRDVLGEPQAIDLTFEGGERIRLGPDWEVQVVSLPGHSRGHLGLLDRKNQALYGGDAVHGSVYLSIDGEPALCPTYLYVQPYLNTIRFIEHLDIDLYSGCHWSVKEGDEIEEFCAESRRFVYRTEKIILQRIDESEPKSLTELCYEVGSAVGSWPEEVNHDMCYAVAGHLRNLRDRGLVRGLADDTPVRFTLTDRARG